MAMEIQSRITKIFIFVIVNIIVILLLYNMPIESNSNICVFKNIVGTECWNCGMTRAFLSIIHLKFDKAMYYNKNVIFVFPLTVLLYLYSWAKFIVKKHSNK